MTISFCSRRLNVWSSVPRDAGGHDEVAREEVAEHGTYIQYNFLDLFKNFTFYFLCHTLIEPSYDPETKKP